MQAARQVLHGTQAAGVAGYVVGLTHGGDPPAARTQGIPHRTVYVMLYNSAGELLQQQRHANKSICPGLWVSAPSLYSLAVKLASQPLRHSCTCTGVVLTWGGPRVPPPPTRQDLSAAEHLNPGEPYAEAALRGLREELGVPADDALRASLREVCVCVCVSFELFSLHAQTVYHRP